MRLLIAYRSAIADQAQKYRQDTNRRDWVKRKNESKIVEITYIPKRILYRAMPRCLFCCSINYIAAHEIRPLRKQAPRKTYDILQTFWKPMNKNVTKWTKDDQVVKRSKSQVIIDRKIHTYLHVRTVEYLHLGTVGPLNYWDSYRYVVTLIDISKGWPEAWAVIRLEACPHFIIYNRNCS